MTLIFTVWCSLRLREEVGNIETTNHLQSIAETFHQSPKKYAFVFKSLFDLANMDSSVCGSPKKWTEQYSMIEFFTSNFSSIYKKEKFCVCNASEQPTSTPENRKRGNLTNLVPAMTDTSQPAVHVHKNGPRHIPLKANTPCSNCMRLVTIIPTAKFDSGSRKSKKQKVFRSNNKRLKQDLSLIPILPSKSHQISNLLPDKFYTYVDGGSVDNPLIIPPPAALKPNQILSICDEHLHVV